MTEKTPIILPSETWAREFDAWATDGALPADRVVVADYGFPAPPAVPRVERAILEAGG